ncbi:MAG: ATP-dependent zinc metalloprotease FtsH [Acetobacteraceae bacterium]|nr:ATP-dependent zinc metalloprotease FtsH [Acetobacteraceae bacterium]
MQKHTQLNLWYLLLAAMAVLALQDALGAWRNTVTLPYSQFDSLVEKKQVSEALVGARSISGTLREPVEGRRQFVTMRVEDPGLAERLRAAGVEFSGAPEGGLFATVLSWVLPAVIFVGIWMLFFRRFAEKQGLGGLMSVGRSKAKIFMEKATGVTFADVAGVDEAKAELEEIVAFLKNPQAYGRLGARIPKGVLLVGPPGTGKTLLARAVAGEAGVAFFSISGSEFVEMFVGVGAARVRDLFEQARKAAPCIIFIDELDALGRARGPSQMAGGHDEREQTLNQLLAELDGFDPSVGIVLLAATNRPEVLDPALLRAGRFDRQVLVDRPDRVGRIAILKVHLKKVQLAPDVVAEQIAALTPGFTGADLANLVNEAALLATRRKADAVAMQDFTAAVERIVAGLEKRNRLLNPNERRIVAVHEMGHALVGLAIPGSDAVHKVSIIPRGVGALGYTISRPTEERFLMTREELENKIAVLLGGRAAEAIVFGHLSTGAGDDLARVTDIARSMVVRYAMVETLGNVTYEPDRPNFLGQQERGLLTRTYSEDTAERIDVAIREIVDRVYARTRAILERNRAVLDRTAEELLAHETLDEAALKALTAELAREPAVPAAA